MYSPCCPPNPQGSNVSVKTMNCPTNSPCSTHPISGDSVAYAGPTLPCTQIENCDTVVVAFQKVDEIICDLKQQILTLQQQLNVCCPTTTTTSTSSTSSTTTTSTSSTTTTTTTLVPNCEAAQFVNDTGLDQQIFWTSCTGQSLGATILAGQTLVYCIDGDVPPTLNGVTLNILGSC